MTFTVKAQNGATTDWSVTVHVEYGIAFTFGTTKVVLTHGYIDSSLSHSASLIGNGHAVGYVSCDTFIDAYDADQEVSPGPWTQFNAYLELGGTTAGAYSAGAFNAHFWYQDPGISSVNAYNNADLQVTVSKYGAVGDSLEGSFSCTMTDNVTSQSSIPVDGFFKVLQVDDNPYPGWARHSGG